VSDQRIIIDHATREMEVTLAAESGPYAVFGEIALEGLEEMDEDFVRDRFDGAIGHSFSPEAVRGIRDNLADSRSFRVSGSIPPTSWTVTAACR